MMSKVFSFKKHLFRYDFECGVVEMIEKANEEMLNDNREWQEKFGKDLWRIDSEGYVVIDSVGLSPANWKNKEARKEYLQEWIDELHAYAEDCAGEFI